jgi:hypothetical protein
MQGVAPQCVAGSLVLAMTPKKVTTTRPKQSGFPEKLAAWLAHNRDTYEAGRGILGPRNPRQLALTLTAEGEECSDNTTRAWIRRTALPEARYIAVLERMMGAPWWYLDDAHLVLVPRRRRHGPPQGAQVVDPAGERGGRVHRVARRPDAAFLFPLHAEAFKFGRARVLRAGRAGAHAAGRAVAPLDVRGAALPDDPGHARLLSAGGMLTRRTARRQAAPQPTAAARVATVAPRDDAPSPGVQKAGTDLT